VEAADAAVRELAEEAGSLPGRLREAVLAGDAEAEVRLIRRRDDLPLLAAAAGRERLKALAAHAEAMAAGCEPRSPEWHRWRGEATTHRQALSQLVLAASADPGPVVRSRWQGGR
jgi:hypothetical protein